MPNDYRNTTDTMQGVRDYFRSRGTIDYETGNKLRSTMDSLIQAIGPMGRYTMRRGFRRVFHGLPLQLPVETLQAIDTYWRNSENWNTEGDKSGLKPEAMTQLDAILDEIDRREDINKQRKAQGLSLLTTEAEWEARGGR